MESITVSVPHRNILGTAELARHVQELLGLLEQYWRLRRHGDAVEEMLLRGAHEALGRLYEFFDAESVA